MAALFASLSIFPEVVKPIVKYVTSCILWPLRYSSDVLSSTYLVAGTPQSVLSSNCILAVVSPDEDDEQSEGLNVFQELGVLRSVAQKAQESAANEKPSIARPAREARDHLKASGDGALQGFF